MRGLLPAPTATTPRSNKQIPDAVARRARQDAASDNTTKENHGWKPTRVGVIDYKDVPTLRKFISERGKIRARRITGVSVQEQRLIARAIKNAREMALLPYAGAGR